MRIIPPNRLQSYKKVANRYKRRGKSFSLNSYFFYFICNRTLFPAYFAKFTFHFSPLLSDVGLS